MKEKLRALLKKRLPYIHGNVLNALLRDIVNFLKKLKETK